MLKLLACLVLGLVLPSYEQDTPISPCPNVFMYEPPGTEPGRWYGVVNLSTDSTLHSLWLNIVLDSKADILGNWIGDVSTQDNTDFKVENTTMKIHPGPAVALRFFVQYSPLNKTPKLMAIRLNGREICNANTRVPAPDGPRSDSGTTRPKVTQRPSNTNRPASLSPVYVRPKSGPSPSSIHGGSGDDSQREGGGSQRSGSRGDGSGSRGDGSGSRGDGSGSRGDGSGSRGDGSGSRGDGSGSRVESSGGNNRPNSGFGLTTRRPATRATTYRTPDISDFDESNSDSGKSDYFSGPQAVIVIPSDNDNNYNDNNNNRRPQSKQEACGKVVLNNPIPLVSNGRPTLEGQWPWHVALYHTQIVDSKYICGGTLVSHRHIITAAHCVTRSNSKMIVNHNTLTVYLGKHNLRTSVSGVAFRFVGNITIHPDYSFAPSYSRDLAILELLEPVQYTSHIRSACLWPENEINVNSVIGKKGSVVGWGFDDTGVATEELNLVEMPVVNQETCIRSHSEFFAKHTSEYTICAGYRNGTSVCNGDSGGGMVFKIQDSWYLRGLVSLSVARHNEHRCDPTHYVIFTDIAKFLPWIKQHIYDY